MLENILKNIEEKLNKDKNFIIGPLSFGKVEKLKEKLKIYEKKYFIDVERYDAFYIFIYLKKGV